MSILQISKSQQNLRLNPSGISHQKVILCHDLVLEKPVFPWAHIPIKLFPRFCQDFPFATSQENPASVCGATSDVSEANNPNKTGINEGPEL